MAKVTQISNMTRTLTIFSMSAQMLRLMWTSLKSPVTMKSELSRKSHLSHRQNTHHSVPSRFEEIEDEKPSSKKRPRDSDAMEVAGEDGAEGPSMVGKKEQKKLNKKLKKENGEAVPSDKVLQNGEAKKEKGEKKKEKKEKKEKEGESKDAGLKDLPTGLQIKDVKVGTGKTAKKGDVVSMRYIGKFLNGKIFDQNTKGKPVSVMCGPASSYLVEQMQL